MVYNSTGRMSGVAHAMLFIQESDGKIYFFNPNGFYCDYTKLVLNEKTKFLDLFENQGDGNIYNLFENQGDGNIYNLFPSFAIIIEGWQPGDSDRFISINTNNYGLCRAICRYFKMIIVLNTTQSLYNLLYYLFGKLFYFTTKKLEYLFETVIRKQILDALHEFKEFKKTPHFENLNVNISEDYININMRNDDLWTEATLGFYLFVLETHFVLIFNLIKWCETNKYTDYPDFLTSLDNKDTASKQIYNFSSVFLNEKNTNRVNYTDVIERNVLTIFPGSIEIISPWTVNDVSDVMEEMLPEIYSMLVNAGYDPKKDNHDGGKLTNNNLVLKLLNID